MAKYRVLAKSYINNTIVEAGGVVEYDGIPGRSLELIDEAEHKPEAKAKGKGKAKDAAAPDASDASDGADLV